jgi:hypothetical protein
MPLDVTFHPLDETLAIKYYVRGLEDGTGVVDFDGPGKIVQKRKMVSLVSDFFRADALAVLAEKPNINTDMVLACRPYFISVADPNEVVGVLKLLDQAQIPDEVFDIFHRQAEHIDFNFAGSKVAMKAQVLQQAAAIPPLGQLQMQMYDWLDKKVYRYAMSRFAGLFSGMKIGKFRPKRMTAQEEQFFKVEAKRKPEDISVDIGATCGLDVATVMMAMYPHWSCKQLGLTDLKAWADHLFPTIESPHYLFADLSTYNLLEPHIPKRVRPGTSGGVVKAQNVGHFLDTVRSAGDDIVKIFDRVGHYKDMTLSLLDRLTEVAQYSLQRGFGIIEAAGVTMPY